MQVVVDFLFCFAEVARMQICLAHSVVKRESSVIVLFIAAQFPCELSCTMLPIRSLRSCCRIKLTGAVVVVVFVFFLLLLWLLQRKCSSTRGHADVVSTRGHADDLFMLDGSQREPLMIS